MGRVVDRGKSGKNHHCYFISHYLSGGICAPDYCVPQQMALLANEFEYPKNTLENQSRVQLLYSDHPVRKLRVKYDY